MSSLNKVMLIGRLGQDPELRQTAGGKAVANFSIATSIPGPKTNEGGYGKDEVEWHRIVVWDKLAENCKQFLAKGKLCYVEGRIATKQFVNKDGQKQFSTEIIAHAVQFLSPREEGQQQRQMNFQRSEPSPYKQPTPDFDIDSVPF